MTYNVSDTAGNAATQVIRTVNVSADGTPPVVTESSSLRSGGGGIGLYLLLLMLGLQFLKVRLVPTFA